MSQDRSFERDHWMINLNNAGCSNLVKSAYEIVSEVNELERDNCGYDVAEKYKKEVEDFYTNASNLLNCDEAEIGFTQSSTQGWQLIVESLNLVAGDEVLFDSFEYSSNYLYFLRKSKEIGIKLIQVNKDNRRRMCLDDLKRKISKKTKLISIVDIPTCLGIRNNTKEIIEITKAHGVLSLVDACQSIGSVEVNVQEMNCDFLVASGRKFLRAPRGTGLLYAKLSSTKHVLSRFIDLRSAFWNSPDDYQYSTTSAKRFELWEQSTSLKMGMSAAIKSVLDQGIDSIEIKNKKLLDLLRNKVNSLSNCHLFEKHEEHFFFMTLEIKGFDTNLLKESLLAQGISVSTSNEIHSRLNSDFKQTPAKLRVSPHYYNSEEEIHNFVRKLDSLITT